VRLSGTVYCHKRFVRNLKAAINRRRHSPSPATVASPWSAPARSIFWMIWRTDHATIAFPDPVNRGETGTLTVLPGDRCTVAPVTGSGG
jgi:hypothetical protein